MPTTLKKLFIIDKKRCRVRKTSTNSYEIRFRQKGYNVSASGVTIELAKQNFLKKIKTANPINNDMSAVPKTFYSFAIFYFENFRKEKVAELTYKADLNRLKNHLKPHFNEIPLKNITPLQCKALLDKLKDNGKGKTADEIFSLMNILFKNANIHGIIDKNPLSIIPHTQHERVNGLTITAEEEKSLFENESRPQYKFAFALMLYCGLRPNEIYTAKIDGKFVVSVNSKRKSRKIEYKKIPIILSLKPYLIDDIELPNPKQIRIAYKKTLPSHTLKDLRKTFNSKCKELGVSEHARKYFMGHSIGVLDKAYTQFSDDYLIKEAKKLNKWH